MQIGYKIVNQHEDGKLYSCIVDHGPAEVCYEPNVWATAPEFTKRAGYHPLIFGKLDDARAWFHPLYRVCKDTTTIQSRQIWKCEYKDYVINPPGMLVHDMLDVYIEDVVKHRQALGWGLWPDGTLMVKFVKLIERLDID